MFSNAYATSYQINAVLTLTAVAYHTSDYHIFVRIEDDVWDQPERSLGAKITR